MAIEYIKVLDALNFRVTVVSRSIKNFDFIKTNFRNTNCIRSKNIEIKEKIDTFDFAINCVSIKSLYKVTCKLIQLGFKKILIEKPGVLRNSELDSLINLSEKRGLILKIALNRRHYSSAIYIKNKINNLNISSVHLDFTEWIKGIDYSNYDTLSLKKWLYSNSIHVIDMFFYLFGFPEKFEFYQSGKGNLSWHPSASIFFGKGNFESNIKFTCKADWNGPGRWGIEIVSKEYKYILSPLEKVKKMGLENFDICNVELENKDDLEFKPGLKKMILDFHSNDFERFITLYDYKKTLRIIDSIGGY